MTAHCRRCGRSWLPRLKGPQCPHCHETYTRTRCPDSFPLAMAAVDAALAVYEPTHGAKWTTEQWETHAQHLADHVAELGVPIITLQGAALEEHLVHAAVRALMMVERYYTEAPAYV